MHLFRNVYKNKAERVRGWCVELSTKPRDQFARTSGWAKHLGMDVFMSFARDGHHWRLTLYSLAEY